MELLVPSDANAQKTDSHYAHTYLNRGEALISFAKLKNGQMTGCGKDDCDPLGIVESSLHHMPRQVVQNMYAAVQLAEETEGRPAVWAKACSICLQAGATVWSHSLAFCEGAMSYNPGKKSDKIRKALGSEAQKLDQKLGNQDRTDTKRVLRTKSPKVPPLTSMSSGDVVHHDLSPAASEQHQLFPSVINTLHPDKSLLKLAKELNAMVIDRWKRHKAEMKGSWGHKNVVLDAGRLNNDFFSKTGHDGARREHWPELQNSRQVRFLLLPSPLMA
jgi:hypothetical protein